MEDTQLTSAYYGVYVHDIWGNLYLFSHDLLTCHDLGDCELPLLNSRIHVEYFLHQIEPAATRVEIWRNLYRYAQVDGQHGIAPSPAQMLIKLASVVTDGGLRLFKIKDGSANTLFT